MSSDSIMHKNSTTNPLLAASAFSPPFKTSGIVRAFHSITGALHGCLS
jgi:hypothetical protein